MSNNGPVVADLTVGPAPPPEVRPRPPVDAGVVDVAEAELEASVPHVDESVVRSTLRAVGGGLGYVLGDEDVAGHWRFTEAELDDLTPPLTRVINRDVRLRRAVIRGDEMAVAVALGGYVGRNLTDGHKARKVRRERDGEAAPAETDAGANGPGVAGGSVGWEPGGHGGGHAGAAGGGVDR